jgi:hypothetical protein
MKQILCLAKSVVWLTGLLLGCTAAVWAQENAAPSSAPPNQLSADPASIAPSAQNQRIEHLTHEDAGSRVEELRVGGRSKSVTVTPKAGPQYQIVPSDPSRGRADGSQSTDSPAGRRVWRLGTF